MTDHWDYCWNPQLQSILAPELVEALKRIGLVMCAGDTGGANGLVRRKDVDPAALAALLTFKDPWFLRPADGDWLEVNRKWIWQKASQDD